MRPTYLDSDLKKKLRHMELDLSQSVHAKTPDKDTCMFTCVCKYVCACICACMHVCERQREKMRIHKYVYDHQSD